MTAEEQYLSTLQTIMDSGMDYGDRTGVGRKGCWCLPVRVDLTKEFPLLTTKRVTLRWVAEELFWILSGSTYEPHLREKGVDIWKEWATPEETARFGREEGELGPVYGHCWRNFGAGLIKDVYGSEDQSLIHYGRRYSDKTKRWINTNYLDNGVDQIKWIVDDIKNNPFGTRKILSGWDPREQDKVALPPCHTISHFKVWPDGTLSSFLMQRSCDQFLGSPYNLASYSLLTTLIAHVCDLKPREHVHMFNDVHIYHNHYDAVNEQLGRLPYNPPTITIDDRLRGGGFDALMDVKWEDIELHNYEHHPKIEAPIAV